MPNHLISNYLLAIMGDRNFLSESDLPDYMLYQAAAAVKDAYERGMDPPQLAKWVLKNRNHHFLTLNRSYPPGT